MAKTVGWMRVGTELWELWPLMAVGPSYALVIPINLARFTGTVGGRPILMAKVIEGGVTLRIVPQQDLDSLGLKAEEQGSDGEAHESEEEHDVAASGPAS